jgi:hypothetical protein
MRPGQPSRLSLRTGASGQLIPSLPGGSRRLLLRRLSDEKRLRSPGLVLGGDQGLHQAMEQLERVFLGPEEVAA